MSALSAQNPSVDVSRQPSAVGPSGSGKSTLLSLLLRLYDADGGRVLLDGVDVRRCEQRSLRERMAHTCPRTRGCSTLDDNGALDPVDAALLGAHLLPAVADLHRRGLAHLDVKTENVVLRDGRLVLVDFGSTRRIGSPQPAGRPVGTEGYAAPELEACEPVSAAMDLYGIGTVLAEALTGMPFTDGVPLPDSALTPLVERLLSDDPADRGDTAGVLAELAKCAGDRRPWPAWVDDYGRASTSSVSSVRLPV